MGPAVGSSSPANPYGSGAIGAWAQGVTGSRNVVVGVVDEGIQVDHPDLAANIWTNPWDPPNGIDDDGNGYVDDVHGWDFMHNDNSVYDGPATDYHGTHVAGTIGAVGGNGTGVVGVNWNVTLISAKFLEGTGDTADAIRALDYLTDLKVRHGLQHRRVQQQLGRRRVQPGPDRRDQPRRRPGDPVRRRGRQRRRDDDGPRRVLSGRRQVRPALPERNAARLGLHRLRRRDRPSRGAPGFSNYGAVNVDLGAPGERICRPTRRRLTPGSTGPRWPRRTSPARWPCSPPAAPG